MLPQILRAGDTWTITVPESADYPSADYVPHLFLRGPEAKTLNGTAGSLNITQTAAETKNFTPGVYQLTLYWTKDAERHTTLEGSLEILPNPELLQGAIDGRSHVRRVLDALEAIIEGRATKAHSQIQIAGRTLSLLSPAELRVEWQHYKRLVANEEREARINAGQDPGGRILVRFGPVS